MHSLVLKVVLCVGAVIVGVGSRFLLKKKADNQIEEAMEYLIKKGTGVDIDLSPDTPDKKLSMKAAIKEARELVAAKKKEKKEEQKGKQ